MHTEMYTSGAVSEEARALNGLLSRDASSLNMLSLLRCMVSAISVSRGTAVEASHKKVATGSPTKPLCSLQLQQGKLEVRMHHSL